MNTEQGSNNVFFDLGFDKNTAASLRLRAEMMIQIQRIIKEKGLLQKEAAELFNVSQPRISDLVNRKIEKFSLEKLVAMLAKVNVSVNVKFEQTVVTEKTAVSA